MDTLLCSVKIYILNMSFSSTDQSFFFYPWGPNDQLLSWTVEKLFQMISLHPSISLYPHPFPIFTLWLVTEVIQFDLHFEKMGFPAGLDGKESACNAGDVGLIHGWGRSPGEGNDNPLQYSCLENSMDRGAWWAKAHRLQRVRHDWATKHEAGEGRRWKIWMVILSTTVTQVGRLWVEYQGVDIRW